MSSVDEPTRRPRSRVLIATAVVAGLALVAGTVALVAARSGSDDDGDSAAVVDDWNSIATVDATTGVVTVFDESGGQVEEFATGIADGSSYALSRSTVAVVGDVAGPIPVAIVDVTSGTALDTEIGVAGDATFAVRPVRGAAALVAGSPDLDGTAYVVNAEATSIDVGAEAGWTDPFISIFGVRASPDGSTIALGNFDPDVTQTAIIRLGDLGVTVVDGDLISISDDTVRTAMATAVDTPDASTTITTYDLDGTAEGSFEIASFRAAFEIADGDLITVTPVGDVLRYDPVGSDPQRLATVDVGVEGDFAPIARTFGATPSLIVADVFGDLLLIDSEGKVASDTIGIADDLTRIETGRRCATAVTAAGVVIVDTVADEVIADEDTGDGPVALVATSDDGCTSFVTGATRVLVGPTGRLDLADDGTVFGLSPAGTDYAFRDSSGNVSIRNLAAFDGDPTATSEIDVDDAAATDAYFLTR